MHNVIEKSFYRGDALSIQFEVSINPLNQSTLFWARHLRNTDETTKSWFRIDCNQSFWTIWRLMESHMGTRIEVPEKYWQWAGTDSAQFHNAAVRQET